MKHSAEFVQYVADLEAQIAQQPKEKYRLILRALKEAKNSREKYRIKKLVGHYEN